MELDRTDIEILKILQENSRTSLKTISKKVMLSQPSVKSRMDKLTDYGYIKAFTIEIDYDKLGLHLAFFIRITDLRIHFKEFQKRLKRMYHISEFYSVTGSDNYIIKGFVKNTDEIDQLLSEMMSYGKITTSIILDHFTCDEFLNQLIDW